MIRLLKKNEENKKFSLLLRISIDGAEPNGAISKFLQLTAATLITF